MKHASLESVLYTLDSHNETIGFGELDGKGRELGLQVGTSTYTAGVGPRVHRSYEHHGRTYGDYFADATRSYYPSGEVLQREPGVYYAAYCQTTRAGRAFGASQAREIFTTVEERDAWIAKRIAGAKPGPPRGAAGLDAFLPAICMEHFGASHRGERFASSRSRVAAICRSDGYEHDASRQV